MMQVKKLFFWTLITHIIHVIIHVSYEALLRVDVSDNFLSHIGFQFIQLIVEFWWLYAINLILIMVLMRLSNFSDIKRTLIYLLLNIILIACISYSFSDNLVDGHFHLFRGPIEVVSRGFIVAVCGFIFLYFNRAIIK